MTKEEVVHDVFLSDNFPTVVIGISVFVGLFLVTLLVFKLLGIKINIHSKHVQIGESEKERAILRQQSEWAHAYCASLEYKIPKDETYNGYVTKFILERAYDEIVTWIMFNHLTLDGDYIKVKQQRMKMLIDQLALKDMYRTDEFHKFLDDGVRYVVENLIHIREVYGKKA